jgi:hypothetical protein
MSPHGVTAHKTNIVTTVTIHYIMLTQLNAEYRTLLYASFLPLKVCSGSQVRL